MGDVASADLPGFDVFNPHSSLVGHRLELTLRGAKKWVDPSAMPPAGTVPVFEPLRPDETLFISYDAGAVTTIDTDSFGGITLMFYVPATSGEDLDLSYDIGLRPSNVIYVLELELSTTAPGILPSETVSAFLSPDGVNFHERLHLPSLLMERFLGIPEPGSVLLLVVAMVVLVRGHREAGRSGKTMEGQLPCVDATAGYLTRMAV